MTRIEYGANDRHIVVRQSIAENVRRLSDTPAGALMQLTLEDGTEFFLNLQAIMMVDPANETLRIA